MSIAVSAVIVPSPALRVAQAALCVAVLACGAWSGASLAGALMLAAGAAGALCRHGLVKLARIDISAVGQIRLAVYHQRDARHAGMGQSVRLLPGSTLWPGLLLLRLQYDAGAADGAEQAEQAEQAGAVRRSGQVHWLAVLPDSAAPDVRRRLALAARAIASGNACNAGGIGGTKKNPANP
jgi:toxin CptA